MNGARHLHPVTVSPRTTTEALHLLAERIRAMDAFIEAHGIDYWYRDHDDQLTLDERRAA